MIIFINIKKQFPSFIKNINIYTVARLGVLGILNLITENSRYKIQKYFRTFQNLEICYRGRRLYQYNEKEFLSKFWLLTSFFRITSLQAIKSRIFFNWQHLLSSTYVMFIPSMLFSSLIKIKILIKSHLYCTGKIVYHCKF